MTDTCTITRAGPPTWDESKGEYTSTPVQVYSGPCRIKHPTTTAKDVDSGSQLLAVSSLEVHLPMTAEAVRVGDVVEITASETRAAMAGRRFTVAAPFDGSQTTALRFRVEVGDGR